MKIERKQADPIEVFIPFVIQITLQSGRDEELFTGALRSAMGDEDDDIARLCGDILNVFKTEKHGR